MQRNVIPLRQIISRAGDEEINRLLSPFSCDRDADIQNFLHEKALTFEKEDRSRTYLIVDENIDISNFLLGEAVIYAYITLSLRAFKLPESFSNRQRRKLDGFSAKLHGKPITHIPCYLIGQLARNSNVPSESINGRELLRTAFDLISSSNQTVGGRYILVECRNVDKLIQFYIDNGFKFISSIPDNETSMIQMLRAIRKE